MAPLSPAVDDSSWPSSPGYSPTTPDYDPPNYEHPPPDFEPSSPGRRTPGRRAPERRAASPAPSSVDAVVKSPTSVLPDDWKDHVDEIPSLPLPRPRFLTPTGFREDDSQEERHIPALLQASSWFKIPANLRRDILRLAFGDRRLHMSLKFDASRSPVWQSCGMVCHHVSSEDKGPMTRGSLKKHGPWSDECRYLDNRVKRIGIMGWLLSCRQNYAETIDILYSMNTILVYDVPLIHHFDRLILPHRLARITDLEVRWPMATLDDVDALFSQLSLSRLPNLKRLYVSLEFGGNYEACLAFRSITSVLNKFVINRPGLTECAFALPFRLFETIASDLIEKDEEWERQTYSEVWCSLDGSLHAIRLPYVDSYPHPPYHLGPNPGAGYWLLEGTDADLTSRWRSNSHGWSGFFEGWEDF
ncbi:hypothetical protein FLONG3_4721 [Fusarium longipes]|uniref:DUF7730 domain-containing protein n=1 Tax=Fusarium longipes TaxID=694270 RepID=A0A395SYD6_9HYPO|nr:hypothetical protein FLONG3_4721 [Fusarium longipes]